MIASHSEGRSAYYEPMEAARINVAEARAEDFDQRVMLRHGTWTHYEVLLALRGETSVPRMSYLDGVVELMSPSRNHESIKTTFARLLEAYAIELGIDINGFGSWTLKRPDMDAGAEPDECYIRGPAEHREEPDLALEVVWTSGGLDKLEIYRRLGVREVWWWKKGLITIYVLGERGYDESAKSIILPEIDVALVARFVGYENQSSATRELLVELRAGPRT